MNKPRYLYAALTLALLLVAGNAYAGPRVTVDAGTAPEGTMGVAIVVYDGLSDPIVVAGCSDPDCSGWAGPITGTVTHVKNYVGWRVEGNLKGRITLYVDGTAVTSARQGRLMIWNTSGLAAGPHTLEAQAFDVSGVEGWSEPLTIYVVK